MEEERKRGGERKKRERSGNREREVGEGKVNRKKKR